MRVGRRDTELAGDQVDDREMVVQRAVSASAALGGLNQRVPAFEQTD